MSSVYNLQAAAEVPESPLGMGLVTLLDGRVVVAVVLPVECVVEHRICPFPTFSCGVFIFWILFTMFLCIYLFHALPFHGLCGRSLWFAISLCTFPCTQACCFSWEFHVDFLMLWLPHSSCHTVQTDSNAFSPRHSTTKSTSLNN